MTLFATVAVVAAWVVGTCWGAYLTLKHLDADAVDLDARLAALVDDRDDEGGRSA